MIKVAEFIGEANTRSMTKLAASGSAAVASIAETVPAVKENAVPDFEAEFSILGLDLPDVEQINDEIERFQRDIENTEAKKAQIVAKVHDLVNNINTIEKLDGEVREHFKFKLDENQAKLKIMLALPGKGGVISTLAFVDASIRVCDPDKRKVSTIMSRLMMTGFLAFSSKSTFDIKVLDKRYDVTQKYSDFPESRDILKNLRNLVSKMVMEENKEVKERIDILVRTAGDSRISLAELKLGTAGMAVLHVPKNVIHNGGHILVESDGCSIKLLESIGGLQEKGKMIKSNGAFVPTSQIRDGWEKLVLMTRLPDSRYGLVKTLWHWLKEAKDLDLNGVE